MRRLALLVLLVLASVSPAQQSLQDFATGLVNAQKENEWDKLKPAFLPGCIPARRENGGFPGWNAGVMPPAAGYGEAAAWLVLWRTHGPEGEGDHLFPIVTRGDGWAIGKEIPEDVAVPYAVDKQVFDIRIDPATQIVNVTDQFAPHHVGVVGDRAGVVGDSAVVVGDRAGMVGDRAGMVGDRAVVVGDSAGVAGDTDSKAGDRPLLMRLACGYRITEATFGGRSAEIADSSNGVALTAPAGPALVRCGSVMWLRGKLTDVKLRYSGKQSGQGERAGPDAAFLSAYWWPNMGRHPHKHETTVHVPARWIAIAQGELVRENKTANEYTATWRDDLAVCCHSIAAGPFVIGAEVKDRGRTFRSYMMPDKVDKARAERIVNDIKNACAFYEDRLVKFPYSHYFVIDSPGYYGLEAYSFTDLTPGITSWAPTHEMGHTYFGGVVPNTYLHSIWNEGLTQYIDSALFKKGSDGSLRMGQGSYSCALSEIATVSHPATNEGYMRGTFTMSMLAEEMGLDNLIKCLRRFCIDRRGKSSDWIDLEDAVRKETGGNKWDWFFNQWIFGAKRPDLSIVSAKPAAKPGEWVVTVEQDQSPPYRLNFAIELTNGTQSTRTRVTMTKRRQEFTAMADGTPEDVRIVTHDITLALAPEPLSLKAQR